MLLALDPGRAGLGWAAFSGGTGGTSSLLIACGVVRQPKGPRDYEQASLEAVAENAYDQIWRGMISQGAWYDYSPRHFRECVVERMTSYPGKKAFAANDLLDLQAIGGMVAGALCPLSGVRWLRPQEWKGSVDTEILIARLPSWLSPEELAICEKTKRETKKLWHNGADAVLLGGRFLGRWRL